MSPSNPTNNAKPKRQEKRYGLETPEHEDMKKFLQCTRLTSINIGDNFDFCAGCFLPFNNNKFPYLRELYAPACGMWTEDLEAIANGCPNLEKLNVHANRRIRNAGVIKLCHSGSKLTLLNLLLLKKVSDPGLMAMAECPSLEKLFMGKLMATEKGLCALVKGPSASSLQRLVSLAFSPPPNPNH